MVFLVPAPPGPAASYGALWYEDLPMKLVALALVATLHLSAQRLDIGVFTLFHPSELRVSAVSGPLIVKTPEANITLEGRRSYSIRLARASFPVQVTARDGSDASFHLSIPGKIERRFYGTLTIRRAVHQLSAVVSMDLETAVASVVAAEMDPSSPMEALKAQAVAARSFYVASAARHDRFDFCDTTHCQFLRERPSKSSPAYRAAEQTRSLVLSWQGKPLAALYSASCGGQTRSLDHPTNGYPYFPVNCEFCRRHSPNEMRGHQLGLCQAGAAGMAQAGAGFREILDHYYPGTALVDARDNAIFLLPLQPALRHIKY